MPFNVESFHKVPLANIAHLLRALSVIVEQFPRRLKVSNHETKSKKYKGHAIFS